MGGWVKDMLDFSNLWQDGGWPNLSAESRHHGDPEGGGFGNGGSFHWNAENIGLNLHQ